ncbi:PPE family protein [Mycolicibacter arupensis]|jgi:PPE-repeat protein|uniref:PPE family protein n=1 Tax=Mycolicibacter arupensis TaxID=342002 RepID=A0A5C7Y2M0_9MYCO|nr:PPE family protein [Mycolicibacter arupensis]MCV7276198.1 PPE family protein [Mycolicibacter arupensis]ORA01087.1 PPE family protein [Mycolicibacter arupensis]TXI55871.1 MAG: PPE family protein [Mycolicibacter arupensis]
MDFALLPPEVNSSRMYSGAGARPLMAAASAWSALAAELSSMGLAYDAMIDAVRAGQVEPGAAAMTAAAAPFAQWMHVTSAQAERVASAARSAAAAYDTAFAMTAPPSMVTANRAQLMSLVVNNFLGHNTAAIAATEAQYSHLWAQNGAAMYGYAVTSTVAARLAPFTQPPRAAGSVLAAPSLELADRLYDTFVIAAAGTFGVDLSGADEIASVLLPEMAPSPASAPVCAERGEAATLNGLSVPRSWAAAVPATVIRQIGAASPNEEEAVLPAAAGAPHYPWHSR